MANLDTQLKRMSGMHLTMPWRMGRPPGAIAQADRQAIAFMYSDILASGAAPATAIDSWRRHLILRRGR